MKPKQTGYIAFGGAIKIRKALRTAEVCVASNPARDIMPEVVSLTIAPVSAVLNAVKRV